MSPRTPLKLAVAWLALAALGLISANAHAQALVRWLPPADADLAGYVVYASIGQAPLEEVQDVGLIRPDQAGVAAYDLGQLLEQGDYNVALSAYDFTGNESKLSNSVRIKVEGNAPQCVTNSDCSDGDRCNGTESCQGGLCMAGTALVCTSSNACQQATCSPTQGCMLSPLPNTTRCDDGNARTFNDLCTGGVCTGVECGSDGDCKDATVCNGAERCVAGSCQAGSPLVCPSDGRCGQGACDATQGCLIRPVTCPAAGACQVGRCDQAQGCLVDNLADGTVCDDGDPQTAKDSCRAGKCSGESQGPDACAAVLGEPHAIHLALAADRSLEVRWRAPLRKEGLPLRYRTADGWRELTGNPVGLASCESEYRVSLKQLPPAFIAEYAVGGPGPRGIVWSSIDPLRTPPPDDGFHQAAFFGSTPTDPAKQRAFAEALRMSIAPQLVLGGGDFAGADTTSLAVSGWIDQLAPFLRLGAFRPTVGGAGLDGALVALAVPAPSGGAAPATYGFDHGGTHYLAIGAANAAALDPAQASGRAHLDQIEDDLAAAAARGKRWLVVYMQLDLYSSLPHSPDPVFDGVRDALATIFERNGVDLVLSSGGAGYERSHPMAGGTAVPQSRSVVPANQGVIYVRASARAPESQDAFAVGAAPDWAAHRAMVPAYVAVWDAGARGLLVRGFTYDQQSKWGRRIDGVLIR